MSILLVALGVIVPLVIVCMVYAISREKHIKEKLIIWGLTIMLVLAPFLSVPIGILFGISKGDGFAGAALLIIMFICLFLFGLILLLAGVFRVLISGHKKEVILWITCSLGNLKKKTLVPIFN